MNKTLLLASVAAGILCGSVSTPAFAQEGTDWLAKERFQLRGRIIGIFADGDGYVKEAPALKTDVGDAVTPEFDITYFFTDKIAAEIIAGTAQHEVTAGINDLGETWILPPTLTLQYHFTPDKKLSPYVGAGLNYSYFYGEDDGAGFDNLQVNGGFGFALQAGVDYWLNDHWGINLDAKYIDLEVDAHVNNKALNAYDVDLNPWVLGVGVSYRF